MPQPLTTTVSKTRKPKLGGIFVEHAFFNDYRFKTLFRSHGPETVIALQAIWLSLSDSAAGRFTAKEVAAVALDYVSPEKLPAMLQYCVESSLLDLRDNFYFSGTIDQRKDKRAAENARKKSGKSPENEQSDPVPLSIVSSLDIDQEELSAYGEYFRAKTSKLGKLTAVRGFECVKYYIRRFNEWVPNTSKKLKPPEERDDVARIRGWMDREEAEGKGWFASNRPAPPRVNEKPQNQTFAPVRGAAAKLVDLAAVKSIDKGAA